MGTTRTKEVKKLTTGWASLVSGVVLLVALNGCGGTAGVAPGSTSGGTETPAATADATLIVPVDSSVSASINKSVVKSINRPAPSFGVGKGVSGGFSSASNDLDGGQEGVVYVAKAEATAETASNVCNCYDGKSGTLLNTEPAKIEGGQAKLLIDSSKISSADALPLVECKVNNTTLPVVLPKSVMASLKNISTSDLKEVTSPLSVGPASFLAFQQMAIGLGKSDVLGTISSNRVLPSALLEMNPVTIFNDIAKIRTDSSNALAKAYEAQARAITGMISSGGVDIAATMKNVAGGSVEAAAQYGGYSVSEFRDYSTLAVKDAQYFVPAMADTKFFSSYQSSAASQTQFQDVRKTTATSGTAAFTKMAAGMIENPTAMLGMMNDSSFVTMPPAAAMRVVEQAVDNKMFSSTIGANQFETFYKATAAAASAGTITNSMDAAKMEKLMEATVGYISANNITSATTENIMSAYSAFDTFKRDDDAGRLDQSQFSATYFTEVRTTIQTQVLSTIDFTNVSTTSTTFFTQTTQLIGSTLTNFYTNSWETMGGSTSVFTGGGDLILSFNPIDTETLVAVSGLRPQVTISGPLDFNSVMSQNMSLVCGGSPVAGSRLWDAASRVWKFIPSSSIVKNASCVFSVANVRNLSGLTFSRSITFTTERDNFAIGSWSIANGATNVATNANICATANYAIDSSKLSNITLNCGGSNIAGAASLSNGNLTVCFDPNANLAPSTSCTLTAGANLGSIYAADHILGTAATRNFTTGLGSDVTAPDVSGAVATLSSTSTTVTVAVAGATDDSTAANQLVCDVYSAAASGSQDFGSAPNASSTGCTGAVVSGLTANTTYYLVVRVKDSTGNYSQLAQVTRKTAPPLPSFPWANWEANNSRVAFGSLKATGAVSFKVYRGLSSDTVSYIGAVVAPDADAWNTYYDNISSPKPYGTAYCYKVTSVGSGGEESERSSCYNASILLQSPGLNLSVVSESQIDISWGAVTDAASYKLYRSFSSWNCSDQATPIYEGVGTSYSDTGRSADTEHKYCARAITSNNIDGALGTNSTYTKPPAPSSLSCSGASSTSATCSWSLPANFYYLELKQSTGGNACDVNSGSIYTVYYWQGGTTGYTNTGLTAGTQYNYCLRWQTSTGYQWSAMSGTQSVTPQVGTVSGVSATVMSSKRIAIRWTALSGATSYKVYRKTSSGVTTSDTLVATVTGTMLNDAGLGTGGLSPGTTYYYKVEPYAGATAGTLSSEVSAALAIQRMAVGGGTEGSASFSLFIKSNGSLWATGFNTDGELGDNTTTAKTSPVQVLKGGSTSSTAYLEDVVDIDAAGGNYRATAMALKGDGTVWVWGENSTTCCGSAYYMFGDGSSTAYRTTPGQVPGLTGIIDVAMGNGHVLAVKNDGTVWTWGQNAYSSFSLGDNTTNQSATPVQVHGVSNVGFLTNIVAVDGGFGMSYALAQDGTVYYWGRGIAGRETNVPVVLHSYLNSSIAIASGYQSFIALGSDGTARVWGSNWYKQAGTGDSTTYFRSTPTQVVGTGGSGTLSNILGIAMNENRYGYVTSYAFDSSGDVYSWGYGDTDGTLGDGTSTTRSTPTKLTAIDAQTIIGIGAGPKSGYAIDNTGDVWAWGNNGNGNLGDGSNSTRTTPVSVNNIP